VNRFFTIQTVPLPKVGLGSYEQPRRGSAVHLGSDASEIILDLSNVTLVDAHGLGVLLQLREQILASEIHFELINVNPSLLRIFEITPEFLSQIFLLVNPVKS